MSGSNHLVACLSAASAGRSGATFATDAAGRALSLGALWDGAARVAQALAALGVAPGDRVALQAAKSLRGVEAYLGTVMAGAVHLPLNPAYTDDEVGYFLGDAAPVAFVCDPAREATLSAVARRAGVAHLLTLDARGEGGLADAARAEAPMAAAVPRGPDDLAALLYTSGTTGRSKGAMLTHGNLTSNAAVLADLWRFSRRDVLIHALPIFHTHGLFVALNVTLVAGGGLLFHTGFDADAVLADFARATCLMGVPTYYTRLLDHPGLDAHGARGMRLSSSRARRRCCPTPTPAGRPAPATRCWSATA